MKMKRLISFIIVAAILTTAVLSLSSCDRPDIYNLIEYLLNTENPYEVCGFDTELNIKIKDSSNEAIPDELNFKIDGQFYEIQAEINITLEEFKTTVYKYNNLLYFELNDLSRIIVDLLCAADFIDEPVKILFDSLVEYDDGSVICFDLTDFDLSYFDKYANDINKIFDITSNYKIYGLSEYYELYEIPDWTGFSIYDEETSLHFSDIKTQIDKGLLKLPYYRYSELYIILETDETDNNNYINILATREHGEREILDKVKIDCDLSKVRENPDSVFTENIIPMRYVFELLGETVEWDSDTKQAYIIKDGKNIYFEKNLINSKTYINLLQIMVNTDYSILTLSSDEYIEFKISR